MSVLSKLIPFETYLNASTGNGGDDTEKGMHTIQYTCL